MAYDATREAFALQGPDGMQRFSPKPDITAYEIALMLEAVVMHASREQLARFPPEMRRHFEPVARIAPL